MVGSHWFVHPVENGIELVIDSRDGAVYDRALAEFVTHFLDYDLVAEWSTDEGEVLRFVPAPLSAAAVVPGDPGRVPAPRTAPEAAEAC
jgi:hypothetical protein